MPFDAWIASVHHRSAKLLFRSVLPVGPGTRQVWLVKELSHLASLSALGASWRLVGSSQEGPQLHVWGQPSPATA